MRTRIFWPITSQFRTVEVPIYNLPIIYGLRAFIPVIALAVPTIVSFWQSHGLSLSEIMVLEAFFATACILFEVPAGYLADRFERRHLLRFGGIMVLVGLLLYCVEESFGGFLIAEVALAVGFSSISGADEALLYDSLAEIEAEHTFSKHWSRILSLEMAVASFAFVIGSIIASSWGLRSPFYLAAFAQCGFIVLAFLLREPDRTRPVRSGGYVREIFRTAVEIVVVSPETRWLILVSALLFSFTQAGFWLYQPYFKECEIPLVYNGVILAVLGLSASALALHVPKFAERWGILNTSYLLVVLGTLGFLVIGSIQSAWVLPALLLHQVVRAFVRVLYSERLHRFVDSSVRATSVSVKNIVSQATYALLLLVVGWFAEWRGVGDTLLMLGVGTLLLGLVVVRKKPSAL